MKRDVSRARARRRRAARAVRHGAARGDVWTEPAPGRERQMDNVANGGGALGTTPRGDLGWCRSGRSRREGRRPLGLRRCENVGPLTDVPEGDSSDFNRGQRARVTVGPAPPRLSSPVPVPVPVPPVFSLPLSRPLSGLPLTRSTSRPGKFSPSVQVYFKSNDRAGGLGKDNRASLRSEVRRAQSARRITC